MILKLSIKSRNAAVSGFRFLRSAGMALPRRLWYDAISNQYLEGRV